MKKVEIVKTVGTIIVGIGVGEIVGNAIKCTTNPSAGKIVKVCVMVAGWILTGMISDKAMDYTEKTIDDTVESIKNMVANGDLS
jgi:beta-lactam-binding protein with PASTA domain